MAELRLHVHAELAERDGVVVIDPSAFPKKGTESCGVARQWCGRLGKVDNCQVGVFLAYAAKAGYAPLDRRLFLPKDWAADKVRRKKCHVPPGVKFQEKWRIALDLLDRSLPGLLHSWIVGDDEFGRAAGFRAALRSVTSVTSWTCLAPPRCVTWSDGARHDRRPGSVAGVRCRSAGPTPGQRTSRNRGGSGSPSAVVRKARSRSTP